MQDSYRERFPAAGVIFLIAAALLVLGLVGSYAGAGAAPDLLRNFLGSASLLGYLLPVPLVAAGVFVIATSQPSIFRTAGRAAAIGYAAGLVVLEVLVVALLGIVLDAPPILRWVVILVLAAAGVVAAVDAATAGVARRGLRWCLPLVVLGFTGVLSTIAATFSDRLLLTVLGLVFTAVIAAGAICAIGVSPSRRATAG
jgi:hypothetical protein